MEFVIRIQTEVRAFVKQDGQEICVIPVLQDTLVRIVQLVQIVVTTGIVLMEVVSVTQIGLEKLVVIVKSEDLDQIVSNVQIVETLESVMKKLGCVNVNSVGQGKFVIIVIH